MKTRATTHFSIERELVLNYIPTRFRGCVDVRVLGELVDLFVFPTDVRNVVSSKDLRQALERRPPSDAQLVAVAVDFTTEALDLIDELRGISFSMGRGFYAWTDERLHAHLTKST